MRGAALYIGSLLALFTIPGFAAPAMACRSSRPVFAADPGQTNGAAQVRVKVEQALMIGGHVSAVRATVLGDTAIAHDGDRIVIVIPRDDTPNCYYGGLADPETVVGDGSLEGYVDLTARLEPSGAFSARLAEEADRRRYNAFAQGRIRGTWAPARFGSGHD